MLTAKYRDKIFKYFWSGIKIAEGTDVGLLQERYKDELMQRIKQIDHGKIITFYSHTFTVHFERGSISFTGFKGTKEDFHSVLTSLTAAKSG